MESRGEIRREIRARRRALAPRQQKRAAQRLMHALRRWPYWRRAQRIALYLPNDGELDPMLLAQTAWQEHKQVYLPVLAPTGGNILWFRRFCSTTRLVRNRFGIPEPAASSPRLLPQRLDLVLAPLVAFDARGHRLGMGGGFYDRTFGFIRRRLAWQHPRLIGVAHHFQQVECLPAEPWDVPLAAVATDQGLLRPRR